MKRLICFFLLVLLGMLANRLTVVLCSAAVGVLFKPQMVFMLPVLIPYTFFTFSVKKGLKSTCIAIMIAYLTVLPFLFKMPITWLYDHFVARTSLYPFTSIHAGTLIGFLGSLGQESLRTVDEIYFFHDISPLNSFILTANGLIEHLLQCSFHESSTFSF